MIAAPTPAVQRRRPLRGRLLRSAACAALLLGSGAAAGCRGAGGPLASTETHAPLAADPFGAAELAMSDAGAGAGTAASAEGRVKLGGGVVRTASVDVTRTVARPTGVTRIDPSTPPGPATRGWQPGEGKDAPAAVVRTRKAQTGTTPDAGQVTLAGGAFAASEDGVTSTRVARAAATAPAAVEPAANVDWAAEMAEFAGAGDATSPESAPSTDSAATPDDPFSTPVPESETPEKGAADAPEGVPEALDQDSLPPAPLWNAPAAAPAAEPVAEPTGDPLDAPQPTSAQPPGGGWHSRKTSDIDPFAGL